MFERRLKVVLTIPILGGLILIARLYRLQIVDGPQYEKRAEQSLIAPKRFLPPLRGSILDRHGKVLVSDEPTFDLSAHYGALSENEDFLKAYAREIRRQSRHYQRMSRSDAESEALLRVQTLYDRLAELTEASADEYFARRDAIVESVEFLRDYIWQARAGAGIEQKKEDMRLREEDRFHTLIRDLDRAFQARIEIELGDLSFFRIVPAVRRVWQTEDRSLAHLLGRIGQVSKGRLEEDPRKTDWLARYRAGDLVGVSGVEYLAEDVLRGTRGYEEKNLDGAVIEAVASIDGAPVRLTIDADLQQRVAEILKTAIAAEAGRTGASCVILDVSTREVLAMVSVPGFDQDTFRKHYDHLRDEARTRPLLFRAIAEEYQPGSIVKPVALLAGLKHGVVTGNTTYDCDGSYIDHSKHWHCWTHWKHLPGHGPMAATGAIQHSCNLYFYDLGKHVNARRLSAFYDDFISGPGHDTSAVVRSTGLLEERDGIIPTSDWIETHRERGYTWADGCNYAIGQGEMQITPLQAANMYATLANGFYRDPTVVMGDQRERRPKPIAGISPAQWQLARRGLYLCVNEIGGTAHEKATLENLVICGKTGSAQCVARPVKTKYVFNVEREVPVEAAEADGLTRSETVRLETVAPTLERARELLELPHDAKPDEWRVVERWPPIPEDRKTPLPHAWFAGYAPYKKPRVAMALVIEHGGSGGQVAAPVGRQVFSAILESPHDYLGMGTPSERIAKGNDAADD